MLDICAYVRYYSNVEATQKLSPRTSAGQEGGGEMRGVKQRLASLEKDVADMKSSVRESRERWDDVEQDFKEIALEFCRKYNLKIPERLLK